MFYSNIIGYAAAFRAIQQVDIDAIAVQSYNSPGFSGIISNGYTKPWTERSMGVVGVKLLG